MSRAALIAVGSELLGPGRVETNSAWIAARLERVGVEVGMRVIVSDDESELTATIAAAHRLYSRVILTGGIGPTQDDRTRAALARALNVPLLRDGDKERELRERFASAGFAWSDAQGRQADRPEGARWIDNPTGTADGLWWQAQGKTVVALPGVPAEMQRMVREGLSRWVEAERGTALARARLCIAGRSEPEVDALLREFGTDDRVEITVLSSHGAVEIELRARANAGRERVRELKREIVARLGDDLVAADESTLAETVGRLLLDAGQTLATAESCTAGGLAAQVTDVAGASAWFRGGWVVYHDDLKRELAGVDAKMLERHGAVSEAVAGQLASSVRERCRADWGIGVTGVAGPGGGSREKPVGLVHVALAAHDRLLHWKTRHPGDRIAVRERSVVFALDRLRRELLGVRV